LKIYLLVIIIILASIIVNAQQEKIPLFDVQNEKYESSLERFYQTRSITRTIVSQVLESELENDNYMVGPGDKFKISIFGELENQFETDVTPEGSILIPTIGEIDLIDKNLTNAKKTIFDKVSENYINADISVNLIGLRKFRVYLTGEVKKAGTYFAQGSDRLSDILEVSAVEEKTMVEETEQIGEKTGLNDWADDTKIEIRHKGGKISIVDITQYYRNGDKSQNPYLIGGDLIYIPSINLNESYVIIEGNVGFQGIHSIKENENLFDFLNRINAFSKKSNLEKIVLIRDDKSIIIDLLNELEKYAKYKLQNKDRIIVPTLYDKVYVRGEVQTPGALPYLASYMARDYVGTAGMLDSAVDMEDIVIIRQSDGKILEGGDIVIEKGDSIIVPKRGREVFKDYMTIFAPIVSLAVSVAALIISANR